MLVTGKVVNFTLQRRGCNLDIECEIVSSNGKQKFRLNDVDYNEFLLCVGAQKISLEKLEQSMSNNRFQICLYIISRD